MKLLSSNLIKKSLAFVLALSSTQAFTADKTKLEQIVNSKHRTTEFTQRDVYRHPVETLQFFGIKDNMTVVEISPGGGWYSEILAPYLKDNGQYIAAGYNPESTSDYYRKNAKKYQEKLAAKPEIYSKTQLTIMEPPKKLDFVPANTADMVLSFRNTHNWHSKGYSEAVYSAIFKALKPGGVFGLVQHRAGDKTPDTSGKLGYLNEADVIALAKKVGFELAAQSEINANPNDTKDHSGGVWSLPPVLRDAGKDKAKLEAIGESDRMTLKFIKPKK